MGSSLKKLRKKLTPSLSGALAPLAGPLAPLAAPFAPLAGGLGRKKGGSPDSGGDVLQGATSTGNQWGGGTRDAPGGAPGTVYDDSGNPTGNMYGSGSFQDIGRNLFGASPNNNNRYQPDANGFMNFGAADTFGKTRPRSFRDIAKQSFPGSIEGGQPAPGGGVQTGVPPPPEGFQPPPWASDTGLSQISERFRSQNKRFDPNMLADLLTKRGGGFGVQSFNGQSINDAMNRFGRKRNFPEDFFKQFQEFQLPAQFRK